MALFGMTGMTCLQPKILGDRDLLHLPNGKIFGSTESESPKTTTALLRFVSSSCSNPERGAIVTTRTGCHQVDHWTNKQTWVFRPQRCWFHYVNRDEIRAILHMYIYVYTSSQKQIYIYIYIHLRNIYTYIRSEKNTSCCLSQLWVP